MEEPATTHTSFVWRHTDCERAGTDAPDTAGGTNVEGFKMTEQRTRSTAGSNQGGNETAFLPEMKTVARHIATEPGARTRPTPTNKLPQRLNILKDRVREAQHMDPKAKDIVATREALRHGTTKVEKRRPMNEARRERAGQT
jgi:hypothetical protein